MEKRNLGAPVYYFTKMDYEVFRDPEMIQELESGGVNLQAHYECLNIKNGKESRGVAYFDSSYETDIPAVKDGVNIVKNDNGEYAINLEVSYIECVNALAELVQEGISMKEITAADIQKRIQEYAKDM